MKTLPAAIIAGMYGDSDRIILVRIIPESTDTWVELCWATKDITVLDWESSGASKSFAGGVLTKNKLGTIRQSVDIEQGGNVATVSGLTLRILNPEYNGTDRFDQTFASYDLENRKVEIRRAFWTGSSPAWSDTLLLYEGTVEDVDYDHEIYQIKVRDAGFKRHKEIPNLILSTDDYSALPEANKGQVAPLLYGTLGGGFAQLSNCNAVPITRIDKSKAEFLVGRNKLDTFTPTALLYFSGINRWAELYTVSGSFSMTYARPSTLDFPLGVDILAKYYSQLEKQGSQTDPSSMLYGAAVDNDEATGFTLANVEGSGGKLYLHAPMPGEFARIQDEDTDVILKVLFGDIAAGNTGTIKYYNSEFDDGVGGFSTGLAFGSADANTTKPYPICADNSAHGRAGDQSDQNDDWTFSELAAYEFGITMDTDDQAVIKNMYLYIDGLLVQSMSGLLRAWRGGMKRRGLGGGPGFVYHPFNNLRDADNVVLNTIGAEFGAWIDADSRDNGYDETHLIQYGAYIIEDILRNELGLTSTEIDYASFDTLGNTTDGERKDWKFVGYVNGQTQSLNVIREYCQQMAAIFFTNHENKERVASLKKQTAVKTINRTTIQGDSVEVEFSKLENVFNEFYLNYDKLWVADNYRETLYVTASSNNLSSNTRSGTPNTYTGLCADSQSKYNTVKRLTIDCEGINDAATAELLIKWLAEWHCYRKRIFPFESDGLDHINLEMGDQIKINHTLLPAGVSDDASFVVFDIKDDLDNDRMKFECMQIPDLLP